MLRCTSSSGGNNRQACFYADEDYRFYLDWLREDKPWSVPYFLIFPYFPMHAGEVADAGDAVPLGRQNAGGFEKRLCSDGERKERRGEQSHRHGIAQKN